MTRFVKEVSITRPCLTIMISSQSPFLADKASRRERSVLLKLYLMALSVTTCSELIAINSYCLGQLGLLTAINGFF